MPAFHAIMVLRDEGDIIAQTLEHLLTWVDALYIYDTGSLDDTWDIVNDYARRDNRIIPVASEPVLFVDGLRGWLFDRFRANFQPGDWIARVDADEFYHIPPPQFVSERVRRCEGRVCLRHYDFVITRSELKAWQDGRESPADRRRPIEERRRYFKFGHFPEQRFFRYRRTMKWSIRHFDPFNGGLTAVERIPVRHYRARDPIQLQVSCAIRAAMAPASGTPTAHWHGADWRLSICYDDSPHVNYWKQGTPLPEPPLRNHLAGLPMRLGQHIFYRAGLVQLRDRIRRSDAAAFRPAPLPPDVAERLRRYLDAVDHAPRLRNAPLPVLERNPRHHAEV